MGGEEKDINNEDLGVIFCCAVLQVSPHLHKRSGLLTTFGARAAVGGTLALGLVLTLERLWGAVTARAHALAAACLSSLSGVSTLALGATAALRCGTVNNKP